MENTEITQSEAEIVETPIDTVDNTTETTTATNESANVERIELPVNAQAQEDQNLKYKAYSEEVVKVEEYAKSTSDFKSARKNIADAKEKIVSLFLIKKEDKDALIERLQLAYEGLKVRQEELKKDLEENNAKVIAEFEPKFNETLDKARSEKMVKDGKELLKQIQNELKALNIKREAKDEYFAKINNVFDELNTKLKAERETLEAESNENYEKVKPKVEEIISNSRTAERFKDARQSLIDLQNEIKTVRISREKKDEIFGEIRKAFDDLNERQDKDRAAFNETNKVVYSSAKENISAAVAKAHQATTPKEAREILIEAQKSLKDLQLLKSQRDELYGTIREIFEKMNGSSDEDRGQFEIESKENYEKIKMKIAEADNSIQFSNDFREIREGLVAINDEIKIVKLKREQRNELFSSMRKLFEIFDKKRAEFSSKRVSEKKEKLLSLISNLEGRIANLTEMLNNDSEALSKQKVKLDSDDALNTQIQENIANIETRMKERQTIIDELKVRIDDINKSISELK
jgi:hypothetical protein